MGENEEYDSELYEGLAAVRDERLSTQLPILRRLHDAIVLIAARLDLAGAADSELASERESLASKSRRDVHAQATWFADLGLCASLDHFRATIELSHPGDKGSANGAMTCARAGLEAAGTSLWLLESEIGGLRRAQRVLAYRWSSANWSKGTYMYSEGGRMGEDAVQAVLEDAAAAGLERQGNNFGDERYNLTSVVESHALTPDQFPELGDTYSVLSVLAHSRPGVAAFFSPDQSPDLFAERPSPTAIRLLPLLQGALSLSSHAVTATLGRLLEYLGDTENDWDEVEDLRKAFAATFDDGVTEFSRDWGL